MYVLFHSNKPTVNRLRAAVIVPAEDDEQPVPPEDDGRLLQENEKVRKRKRTD
jgi:hypothetical protein